MSPATRRLGLAALSAALVVALPACFTGERPTLAEGARETDDPAANAVLARLETTSDARFTATYRILSRYGGATAKATVTQAGPARRAVTIGRVRFLVDGADTATCDLTTGECSETIDAQRVSNLQITPDFYASSAAARLRRDTSMRAGGTRGRTEVIAGQPATCVLVPAGGTESTYCALDAGPLARLDGSDVSIELTNYSPTPDPRQLQRPE